MNVLRWNIFLFGLLVLLQLSIVNAAPTEFLKSIGFFGVNDDSESDSDRRRPRPKPIVIVPRGEERAHALRSPLPRGLSYDDSKSMRFKQRYTKDEYDDEHDYAKEHKALPIPSSPESSKRTTAKRPKSTSYAYSDSEEDLVYPGSIYDKKNREDKLDLENYRKAKEELKAKEEAKKQSTDTKGKGKAKEERRASFH